ncbi:IclR family transcriptional regulator [Aliishimia ponticola]|nr:IclR family transcriptional regulator [Aliishimia ponticola]
MSTVDKALGLLRHFSVQSPELGLSELSRLAGYDKTTTLRCLTALERNGFVEQDAQSRKYRLGLAPINLAQIREQSFPVQSVIKRYLDELADALGETAHATLITGDALITAAISEPDRALRVYVDPSAELPAHATASGIAITAFSSKDKQDAVVNRQDHAAFTKHTPQNAGALKKLLAECRATGVSHAHGTFEDDVIGTAAPIFGPAGTPIGAIAVAAVSMRMTPDLQNRIDQALRIAAQAITRDLGGTLPGPDQPLKETLG